MFSVVAVDIVPVSIRIVSTDTEASCSANVCVLKLAVTVWLLVVVKLQTAVPLLLFKNVTLPVQFTNWYPLLADAVKWNTVALSCVSGVVLVIVPPVPADAVTVYCGNSPK